MPGATLLPGHSAGNRRDRFAGRAARSVALVSSLLSLATLPLGVGLNASGITGRPLLPAVGKLADRQGTSDDAGKGVCAWVFPGVSAALKESGAVWYLTWSTTHRGIVTPPGSQFVPMVARASSVTPDALAQAERSGPALLTFNEPDLASQANMTVAGALSIWPKLMATGLQLASPAVATGAATPGGWLDQFMQGVDATPLPGQLHRGPLVRLRLPDRRCRCRAEDLPGERAPSLRLAGLAQRVRPHRLLCRRPDLSDRRRAGSLCERFGADAGQTCVCAALCLVRASGPEFGPEHWSLLSRSQSDGRRACLRAGLTSSLQRARRLGVRSTD